MLAIKINNPEIETELAELAAKRHTSRQTIVREIVARELENRADYRAALKASRDLASGKTKAIPLEDVMKRYGLAN